MEGSISQAVERHEEYHSKVRKFCLALLNRVKFVLPDLSTPGSDRVTSVKLTESQREQARAIRHEYDEWLECALRSPGGSYLTSSDANLLKANAAEIATYIMME